MTIREHVTEALLDEMLVVFRRTYNDYKRYKCTSTIIMLIVHLYEVVLVTYTLHYSQGFATYSVVKEHLPNMQNNQEFVRFKDDVVHNLPKIKNFNKRLEDFLIKFTKENFLAICEECSIDSKLYDELLDFSFLSDEQPEHVTAF